MKDKKLTIILIVLLSILTLVLTTFFILVLVNNKYGFNFGFGNNISDNLILDETYDNTFDEIKVNSKAGDVEVKTSNDDKIRLVVYGNEDYLKINNKENNFEIKINTKPCIGICFNRDMSKIELYLPETYDKKLTINSSYGDVYVGEFENIELDVKLSAGDLDIVKVKSGKIVNKYGDIKIKKYSKNLDIEQDCGDVVVDEVNDIKVINKYGDIKIYKVNNSLSVSDSAGDIKINELDIKENSSIHNSLGNIEIGFTNEIYINAKTKLGETRISNNYQKSDITLNIDNSCGDISVNN